MSFTPAEAIIANTTEEIIADDAPKVGHTWTTHATKAALPCWAKSAFPCLPNPAVVIGAEVAQWGYEEIEAERDNVEYSLIAGEYTSREAKVEIEDTEGSKENKEKAWRRIDEIYNAVFPTGVALWALIIGGGYFSGQMVTDCEDGPKHFTWVFAVVAVVLQIFMIQKLTILCSKTTFEGRPLVNMIAKPTGFSNMRVASAMAALSMLGKFTRARFVGYVAACQSRIHSDFTEPLERSKFTSWIAPIVVSIGGFQAVSKICLIASAGCLTGVAMWHRHKLRTKLAWARQHTEQDENMMVSGALDHFVPYMRWAKLEPIGQVFFKASLPATFEDAEDATRVWHSIRSQATWAAASLLSDSILQMTLQANFLALDFRSLHNSGAERILVGIVLTSADLLVSAVSLFRYNMRLPVFVGLILLVLPLPAYFRLGEVLYCDSSVFDLASLSCLPESAVRGEQ